MHLSRTMSGAPGIMLTSPQMCSQTSSEETRYSSYENTHYSDLKALSAIRMAFAIMVKVKFFAGSELKHAPSIT